MEGKRLAEAGLTRSVIDAAARTFIGELINKAHTNELNLCYNDLTNILYADYLSLLFPNSKFIFIIRDGLATVNSILSNKINAIGFSKNDFKNNLINWNDLTEVCVSNCMKVGPDKCLSIYFEQLIIDPDREIKKISDFLNIPLNNQNIEIMEDFKAKNLNSWIENVPKNLINEINEIAPLMKKLGYQENKQISNNLMYNNLAENMHEIRKNRQYWIDLTKNETKLANFRTLVKYFQKDLLQK